MSVKIQKKIAIKEPNLISNYTIPNRILLAEFQFPKEFKRNWLKQIDFRFLLILIITFIVEVALVIIASSYFKASIQKINVEKIQKQYAHLLLKEFKPKDFSAIEFEKENKNISSTLTENKLLINKSNALPLEESSASLNATSDKPTSSLNYQEIAVPALDQRKARRAVEKKTFSSALSREISQKGLLHYLYDGSSSQNKQDIVEIYELRDQSARYLQQSIGDINLADISSNNGDGNYTDQIDLDILNRLRSSHVTASVQQEVALLNPVNKLDIETANKNTELDIVPTADLIKNEKNTNARTPEHVTKILISHNRAIQDCYKQAARKDPNLKGKIVVRISVNPKGRVESVKILEATIQNEQMLRCIVHRIRQWRDFGECDPELGTVNYRQTYVFGY